MSETRIRTEKKTAGRLGRLKQVGDSYDDVINDILDHYEKAQANYARGHICPDCGERLVAVGNDADVGFCVNDGEVDLEETEKDAGWERGGLDGDGE